MRLYEKKQKKVGKGRKNKNLFSGNKYIAKRYGKVFIRADQQNGNTELP